MSKRFDAVILNGKVIDGTGRPAFDSGVAVSDGRVAQIGKALSADADRVIEANGLCVAPGFIDTHAHSDLTMLVDGKGDSMVRQGITTSIVGLCGLSAAPVSKSHLGDYKAVLSGITAHYALAVPEVGWDWTDIGGYLRKLEEKGVSPNVGTLVGHSAVRIAVLGMENRPPSPSELDSMRALVDESMKQGAYGFTSGLDFAPGKDAMTEELTELAKVAAKHGGLYVAHQRNGSDHVEDATRESIEVAEKSGAKLIISHLVPKLGGWGKGPALMKMVEDARSRGMDVVFDDYYTSGAPPSLLTLLPSWVFEGGVDAMIGRLKDPESRARIKNEFTGPLAPVVRRNRWDLVTVTSAKRREFVGRNIAQISEERKADPWDIVLNLLAEEEGKVEFVTYFRSAEDAKLMIADSLSIIETDTCSAAPYGPLGRIKDFKSYNLYPHLIRTYVREQRILTIEEFVRKTTKLAAEAFGLADRGEIRQGAWADLVVFDPVRVAEQGSFGDPVRYPEGIDYVMVNGRLVVEKGKHTGALPGKVLRHTASRLSFSGPPSR